MKITKIRKIGKKGMISTLGKVILALLFIVIVFLLFFDDGALIDNAFTSVRNAILMIPETDPTTTELDFFRNNDKQLNFLNSFNKILQDSSSGTPINGACISELPPLDQEGFYEGRYNLYIEKEGANTVLRLTRYANLDVEAVDKVTETPVSRTVIENVLPCIITGDGAIKFYQEFNDIQVGQTPDPSKITPKEVYSLKISSGLTEDDKRQIGTKETEQGEYILNDFFKKGDKTTIYTMRIDRNNKKYLCFFPGHTDRSLYTLGIWVSSVCGAPDSNGFVDLACFDSDAGDKSIKKNINSKLIPETFLCQSIKPNNCLCNGAKISNELCAVEIEEKECNCMAYLANAKYKEGTGKDLSGTPIYSTTNADGKRICNYNAQGCEYYNNAMNSNFVQLAQQTPNPCTP
jgi:hypothetical protein